ncbi:hypothetical protein AC578_3940 [Pseudocercospora eumusae]|uniref:Uncharacterized protein n=1 Tax=Pseudocercospora eumusae TaxID=321146 RepID=A0A139GXJ7_9PEZI|nr:hypothetical protein AC578_3940 [Pseudocercospora eumusae]
MFVPVWVPSKLWSRVIKPVDCCDVLVVRRLNGGPDVLTLGHCLDLVHKVDVNSFQEHKVRIFWVIWAEPHQDSFCLGIDFSHHSELMGSLRDVTLVDAKRIHPEPSSVSSIPDVDKSFKQVSAFRVVN